MKDKRVIVAGAGKSGISSMGLLLRNGASVILFDQNEALDKEKVLADIEQKDRVEIVLGSMSVETMKTADLMVTTCHQLHFQQTVVI